MPELGGVGREFFAEYVAPNRGADREDTLVEPQHGVDFGAVAVGGKAVAMATDPLVVVPELGFERAARFAVHRLLSGVAVSGLRPTHLSVDFNLPPDITDEQFGSMWEQFDAAAREFGVAIATGHTGRYDGCAYPMVGAGTALSVGDPDDLVRPGGAAVGDRVVVAGGPAVGATGLLATRYRSRLESELPAEVVAAATDRLDDASTVGEALAAASAGPVTAMTRATEGGVYGGLTAVARAAGVGLEVETGPIPVQPGVEETCAAFDMDPWTARSDGTLLLTVEPSGVEDVLAALETAGGPAAEAGAVVDGSGLVVDGERIELPESDPFWTALGPVAEN